MKTSSFSREKKSEEILREEELIIKEILSKISARFKAKSVMDSKAEKHVFEKPATLIKHL